MNLPRLPIPEFRQSSSNHRQIFRSARTSLSKSRPGVQESMLCFLRAHHLSVTCRFLMRCKSRASTNFPTSIRLFFFCKLMNRMLGKRAIHCPRTAETVTTRLYEPYAFVASSVPPPGHHPRARNGLVGSWSTPFAAAPLFHAARQCACPAGRRRHLAR